MSLLEVQDIVTQFKTDHGILKAVRGVSFTIDKGETVGVVGESGCGKSVTARSVMRLIPDPPGKISAGKILFKGKDVLKMSEGEMQKVRGNEISMIFQDPMTSLNPVFTIHYQLDEILRLHQPQLSKQQRYDRCLEMLKLVRIPSPEQRLKQYPHELSGGMRQRVMIAIALACEPSLLIADEPTTALDVTVQAQILKLMNELQERVGTAIMLITHDLGVVAETCKRIIVMYLGQVVETGSAREIFDNPRHPYTIGLTNSIPKLHAERSKDPLPTIEGVVPSLRNIPVGCSFAERCPFKQERCLTERPDLTVQEDGRQVRCFYPQGGE
jgi:peptide/nickel transport system ATP-binding protein/oligopeptide transport system ATP-binding protein